MTDDPLTRADLDRVIAEFKAEYRQDMATQVRWIASVVVLQFIAVVGATSTIVFFMLNHMLPPLH